MNIFNLFGSKTTATDDDDQAYSSPNYTQTHYRDDPFYQDLLGIPKEGREWQIEIEAEAEADEAEATKKHWWSI